MYRGMLHSLIIYLLCALVVLVCGSGAASAQAMPMSLRIVPELALTLEQTSVQPPALAPVLSAAETRGKLRRARAFRAAGIGLMVGGMAAAVMGGIGSKCYGAEERTANETAVVSGVLLTALGGGFTISGTMRLQGIAASDRNRHRLSGWLPVLGVGTALTAFFTAMAVSIPETISCSNS